MQRFRCRRFVDLKLPNVLDRTVKMAQEKHLGSTVMYGSCCVSFSHGKPLVKNTFFKSFPKTNAEMVNLKKPDLDLIRSILLECGYFGFMIRFWILPKKRKIHFWIQESVFGFSQKNAPYMSNLETRCSIRNLMPLH